MKTPQILTGQQAIDQYGLNALIECRVAVTTELNGLGHSVMQIGVIADPDSCQIDEDDTGVLWVEYEGADDWYLYSIPADEQFVLLDGKNTQASNETLARRVVDLDSQITTLAAAAKVVTDDYFDWAENEAPDLTIEDESRVHNKMVALLIVLRQQANQSGTWLKDSNTHCNAKAGTNG